MIEYDDGEWIQGPHRLSLYKVWLEGYAHDPIYGVESYRMGSVEDPWDTPRNWEPA